jgi:hypothetical protein
MKKPSRRRFLRLAASAAALPATSRLALAQTYPARPVRLISSFAAGGPNDLLARLIGQWLSERLGQPFHPLLDHPVRHHQQRRHELDAVRAVAQISSMLRSQATNSPSSPMVVMPRLRGLPPRGASLRKSKKRASFFILI